jgi:hypothetical protein
MEKIRQHYFMFDPQPVRFLDMVYVAPIILYAGFKGNFSPFVKYSLIAIGIGTFVYNGVNYVKNIDENNKEKI